MVPAQAAADPSAVVAVCPLTGPGIGACAVVGTVLHEGLQALNGKDAFGPGGEGMKILHGIGGVFTNGSQRNDGIPRMRTSTIRSQD